MSYFFITIIGICCGWLATAITYRLILEENDFGSYFECPLCGARLSLLDLIPLISYFFVCISKCRYCNKKISWLYPAIEFVSGLIFLLMYIRFGFGFKFTLLMLSIYIVFMTAIIDIETLSVHTIFLWILSVFSLIYAFIYLSMPIVTISLSLSIFFMLIAIGKVMTKIMKIDSIGFGDVILIPILTTFLNPHITPYFLISCGIFGLLFGIFWQFFLNFGRRFPFIPPIFMAFFLCVLYQG